MTEISIDSIADSASNANVVEQAQNIQNCDTPTSSVNSIQDIPRRALKRPCIGKKRNRPSLQFLFYIYRDQESFYFYLHLDRKTTATSQIGKQTRNIQNRNTSASSVNSVQNIPRNHTSRRCVIAKRQRLALDSIMDSASNGNVAPVGISNSTVDVVANPIVDAAPVVHAAPVANPVHVAANLPNLNHWHTKRVNHDY